MAQIEIIIRNDNGEIITDTPLKYSLNLGQEKFIDIEDAVEVFRKQSNKEITAILLAKMQQKFISEKKTMKITN